MPMLVRMRVISLRVFRSPLGQESSIRQMQACSGLFDNTTRVFLISLLTNLGRTLQAGQTTSDCAVAVVPTDAAASGAQWGLVAF